MTSFQPLQFYANAVDRVSDDGAVAFIGDFARAAFFSDLFPLVLVDIPNLVESISRPNWDGIIVAWPAEREHNLPLEVVQPFVEECANAGAWVIFVPPSGAERMEQTLSVAHSSTLVLAAGPRQAHWYESRGVMTVEAMPIRLAGISTIASSRIARDTGLGCVLPVSSMGRVNPLIYRHRVSRQLALSLDRFPNLAFAGRRLPMMVSTKVKQKDAAYVGSHGILQPQSCVGPDIGVPEYSARVGFLDGSFSVVDDFHTLSSIETSHQEWSSSGYFKLREYMVGSMSLPAAPDLSLCLFTEVSSHEDVESVMQHLAQADAMPASLVVRTATQAIEEHLHWMFRGYRRWCSLYTVKSHDEQVKAFSLAVDHRVGSVVKVSSPALPITYALKVGRAIVLGCRRRGMQPLEVRIEETGQVRQSEIAG